MWDNFGKVVAVILLGALLCAVIFVGCTPQGVVMWNEFVHGMRSADDASNYETLRKVEDTCRAMIASYKADVLTYEQYRDSADSEKQSWAEMARMRANRTASSYNEYVLKNSYVWRDGVPGDVAERLEVV